MRPLREQDLAPAPALAQPLALILALDQENPALPPAQTPVLAPQPRLPLTAPHTLLLLLLAALLALVSSDLPLLCCNEGNRIDMSVRFGRRLNVVQLYV